MQYATGELKRILLNYREGCYHTGAEPLARYAVWEAVRKHILDMGDSGTYRPNGANAAYVQGRHQCLLQRVGQHFDALHDAARKDLLHACVEPQLRCCKELDMDFKIYDRAPPGSRERTVGTVSLRVGEATPRAEAVAGYARRTPRLNREGCSS